MTVPSRLFFALANLYKTTFTESPLRAVVASPLQDLNGVPFNGGVDLTRQFDLDLGATIQAVVPQPVIRNQVINITDVSQLSDGDTLTIDDGAGGIEFEFNIDSDATVGAGVPVEILSSDDATMVAMKLATEIGGAVFSGEGVTVVPAGASLTITGNSLDATVTLSANSANAFSVSAGGITQQRDQIIVHFNPDELDPLTAEDLTLYQLVDTAGTVDLGDDSFVNPTSVRYDANKNLAVLKFNPGDLSTGTFRLRIGTTAAQVEVNVIAPVLNDDDSSFASANALGSLTGANEKIRLSADIAAQSSIIMPDWPSSADEPGHRQIPAETHGAGSVLGTSAPNAIRKIGFYFPEIYGRNPQNQQLTNEISENQKQRAREIFEMYAGLYGFEVMELEQSDDNPPVGVGAVDQAIAIVTGDIRVGAPGFPPLGVSIGGGGLVIMNGSGNYGQSEFGGSWFNTALHEIGHAIGITHSYDIPSEQGSGTFGEDQYPGNHDIVHGQRIHRPDATDIDVYSFTLPSDGTFSAEVIAERLVTGAGAANPSLLNSAMRLYRKDGAGGELIAQNDDYFSNDSFIGLDLTAGDYFVSISSTGNTDYDLNISDTGFGGLSDGEYDLQLTFDPVDTQQILDTTGTALDGDADGVPGGVFEFHFRTAAVVDTFFVDKANDTTPGADGSGTEADPFDTISQAVAAAGAGDVIRVVANGGTDNKLKTLDDNQPYLIGLLDDQVTALADGDDLEVPADVVLQIDPGAVIKLQYANINAGTTVPGADRSGGAIQILGTPQHEVILTAYGDDAIGGDSDGVSDGANPADWGGIVFRERFRFSGT